MEENMLEVEGFVFTNYKEAQLAVKEQNNIEVIRQRTPLDDKEAVLALYNKLIEREMFKTVVGYSFLYELRYHLVNEFGYEESLLKSVILPKRMEYEKVRDLNQGVLEQKLAKALQIKKRMTIVIVALLFMVISMFVIAAVNPNVGYINTENKVLNKYSAWQEELEEREQAVKEKEAKLNINKDK